MSDSIVLQKARQAGFSITGLTFRSQDVCPGFVFFALKGANIDGNLFIADAVKRGAAMVVSAFAPKEEYGVLYYQSDDIDRDMADAAYEFYGRPSDFMKMLGVTGTKGKTSIAYLIESILSSAGEKVGALGTVSYRVAGRKICSAPNTTPAALPLFGLLAQMKQEGCSSVVMEVSSHSLELQRVRHIWYDTAVFTNLQRDHLDFHHTFENYFLAKQKLFENLADPSNPKLNRTAVINADDPYGRRLAEAFKNRVKIVTFGIDGEADLRAENIQEFLTHTEFTVRGVKAKINLLGRHNVYNALAAWAVCAANGVAQETILRGLSALPGVPGRMERIDEGQNFFAFVDFAYTDESLQRAFKTVEPFKKGRVFVVFGCGGQRDRTKRPLMGRTACSNADYVFLTNDNPRCEDPKQIFADILEGMKGFSNYDVVPDRAEAIGRALAAAQKDDIVIVAGKGHEDYQIVGTEKRHFSDQETVRTFLRGEKHV
uniref:UDP-N-acetylmuramoyl-L-alanyl-D-glutamate--2,6-diaminopimelate ligase n=1 Tax=uncultured Elusimicrobia bacterium TaxID=699876 RepID=A0A650EML7_9BACT|nr:UDP-N-acetylmuramoyl-L-alanyl-D-glutamate--2,6-di aminopimelate ligase [uncultured Elusimicrobia bacterium]